MISNSIQFPARGLGFLILCGSLFAHHGSNASYQSDKTITLTGTVTEWVFAYPHPQLYFEVMDERGASVHWASEIASTPILMKNMKVGWSKESIKPGDQLVIICSPSKVAGATACLARKFIINGKEMPGFGNPGGLPQQNRDKQ